MAAASKRRKAFAGKVDPTKVYPVMDAMQLVKGAATAKFDESVDVAVNLGIDAKKSDQLVRGSVVLPAGTDMREHHVAAAVAAGVLKAKVRSVLTCEAAIGTCAVCYGVMPASASVCSSCGAPLPVQERKIEVVSAELVEAQREQQRIEAKQARRDQRRTHTMEELIALGRSRGYAHPAAWAWHVFNSRKRA